MVCVCVCIMCVYYVCVCVCVVLSRQHFLQQQHTIFLPLVLSHTHVVLMDVCQTVLVCAMVKEIRVSSI
jgi:hypothetical protein